MFKCIKFFKKKCKNEKPKKLQAARFLVCQHLGFAPAQDFLVGGQELNCAVEPARGLQRLHQALLPVQQVQFRQVDLRDQVELGTARRHADSAAIGAQPGDRGVDGARRDVDDRDGVGTAERDERAAGRLMAAMSSRRILARRYSMRCALMSARVISGPWCIAVAP